MHLRAALAQAGFELLSSSANEHEQVLRFGRRMAMLDKPNRSTWQLLAASSTLRHDDGLTQHAAHRLAAAVAFLQAVLGQRPPQRPERTACMHDAELHLHALACMHDAELHGHLGLLMHAQLAAGHVAPRCEGRRCGSGCQAADAGRAWTEPMGAASSEIHSEFHSES